MSENNPIVCIKDLEFSYGTFSAVRGISFDIFEGEVFGLLGTNGAGKTTTLEMIEGFRKPSAGKIQVFGKDPFKEAEEVRKHTGVVLQEAGFF